MNILSENMPESFLSIIAFKELCAISFSILQEGKVMLSEKSVPLSYRLATL